MGSYLGPGEDEFTFEYADVTEDLGTSPPRQDVEDDYEYEWQFCFFTTALREIIEKPSGEYVVGLPPAEVPQVVAGHAMIAEVAPEVARHVKQQSYALDGAAVTLPYTFSALKPGPHVFTGDLVNTTGARFRIVYPFEVVPPLSLTAAALPQNEAVAGQASRAIVVHNNDIHDIKAPFKVRFEGPIRVRVTPAEITVPAKSWVTVRLDVALLAGAHNVDKLRRSSIVFSAGQTSLLVTIPPEELVPALKLPAPRRGPFTFTTDDDDTSDLHIVFTGSGGRLANPKVTPAPSNATADGNQVDILWDPPLPKGTKVDVTVDCPFPVEVYKFFWTYLV